MGKNETLIIYQVGLQRITKSLFRITKLKITVYSRDHEHFFALKENHSASMSST